MNNELNELIEELQSFAKMAKKEVDTIVQKGNLTPAELDSVYKVACIAEKIQMLSGNNMGWPYGMYGNQYANQMAGNGMYGWRPDPYMQYGDDMNGMSGARMRSPVTGRYISRGPDEGYSGHSIEDRMIAALEQQMDSAKSEYERQKIKEQITNIRMSMR